MRPRLTLLVLGVLALAVLPLGAAAADEGATLHLAQTGGGDPNTEADEQQGAETNNQDEAGQSDPDAETGAGQDEQQPGTNEGEAGPVWTYQMSKIILVLLVFVFLGIAAAYYRLVHQRQRAGI